MSYRIMVGVPTIDLENSLIARFEELPDCEVMSVHHTSREVTETLADMGNLDVVLVHESLGPLPVIDLIREISRSHPQLAVILVVESLEPETFTRAMEAGARGVVAAGATIDELGARVSSAGDWSQTLRRHLEAASLNVPVTGRQGSLITLSGSKGGTGTTTIAIQLALRAARVGHSVCLVDLDLQSGDIPGYMDLKHRRSIVDLVMAADSISAAMLAEALYVHSDGPHVLLAPAEGERAEEVTEHAARQVLGALRSRYDIVIVDCGCSTTEVNAIAVELADTAIVSITPDLPSLRGAQRVIAMWGRLQIRDKANVTALLTRHNRKNEIQPDFARKLLGINLLNTAIPSAYRSLEEASNTGEPKRVTDDTLVRALNRLAGELGMAAPSGATPTDSRNNGGPEPGVTSSPEMGVELAGQAPAPPQQGFSKSSKSKSRNKFRRQPAASDRGAQFVEFAALFPLLILAGLFAWQIIIAGIVTQYAEHAALEGARQAAVTPNDLGRIHEEAAKRVIAPWDSNNTFSTNVIERNGGSYVRASMAMPMVLPHTTSPWTITIDSRIRHE